MATLPSDSRTCYPSDLWLHMTGLTGVGPPALRAVAEYVASQSLAFDAETVSFTQHFPRLVLVWICMLELPHS